MNKNRIAIEGEDEYHCDYGPPPPDLPHSGELIPVVHHTFPSEFYLLCEAHAPIVVAESGWEVYKPQMRANKCNG
jgi:hypothetical protein